MSGILYPDESYKIIGACFNVYKAMGCGFLENVYQVRNLSVPVLSYPNAFVGYPEISSS